MSAGRLLSGSGLRTLALLTGMGISFFMMPFLIRSLGDHWYGLWILVASTLGFYGVFDMGLAGATQRYISHALSSQNKRRLNEILSNSIFLYCIIALISVTASFVIAFISPFFFDSLEDSHTFQIIILIMGCTFAIHFVMNAYYGILSAYLRFDIQATIEIIKSVFRAITIYFIFQVDASIINLALVTVLFDLIAQLLVLKSAQRQAKWISPSIALISKKGIGELITFGIHSFILFIGTQIRERGAHFAIGGLLSIASVTLFQIATQLINYCGQLQSALLGVLMPAFTRLLSEGRSQELTSNYYLSLKLSILTASCLCGGILSIGQQFINFWVGSGYDKSYYALSAMAIGYFFLLLHYPSFQLLVALAKHKRYAQFEVLEGVFLVLGTVLIVPFYGIVGAGLTIGIVLSLSRFIAMPIFVNMAWPEVSLKLYAKIFRHSILALMIQAIIIFVIKYKMNNHDFLTLLPYTIFAYLAGSIIFLAISTNHGEKKLIAQSIYGLIDRSKD